ncbi:heme peroxidase [Sinobacterium caligoides]|uniref:Heme peroxidase n=1 Tax=Sinobacterium caligoides TaxID=933926 RepID=A0A3N2DDZ2_9GAMM|nr:peroxidase family protein [Sinobacterium caligoides]ROR98011.1 heme peroxidase [Sinobacterium caligoides]
MIKRLNRKAISRHGLISTPIIATLLLISPAINAYDCDTNSPYRKLDGSCNNLFIPSLGKNETTFKRKFLINNLPDKGDVISGTDFIALDLPAPRAVSNAINDIQPLRYSQQQLSLMFVIFGQFLAHDLVDEEVDLGEFTTTGDFRDANTAGYPGLYYSPDDSGILNYENAIDSELVVDGDVYLAMQASKCVKNRRGGCEFTNRVTHLVDASNIYGSDKDQAAGLRSFTGGLLKTASYDIPVFGAPDFVPPVHLDNLPVTYADGCNNLRKVLTELTHTPDEVVTCVGDSRGHENVMLTAIHVIWMREHNRKALELALKYPTWSDEKLYQEARKYTSALYSKIVYEDWLPALLGSQSNKMKAYQGYSPWIDSRIDLAFSSSAFRVGHSMIPERVMPQDACLNSTINAPAPFNSLQLAGGTGGPFNIFVLLGITKGVDPVLRHMALTTAFEIDTRVENAIRNIPTRNVLFDTLATNLNRARMNGIESYLQLRWLYNKEVNNKIYGLPGCPASQWFTSTNDPLSCFTHLTGKDSDQLQLAETLQTLYGKVKKIDAWVGLMSEPHVENSSVGHTLANMFVDQFSNLRDGDRFYYKNKHFDTVALATIESTSFADIVQRNSDIKRLPSNAFVSPLPSVISDYKADDCLD